MVLPQAMAWGQYWFRVLSLEFCGKSKKNCGDISQVSPAFCMYALDPPGPCRPTPWQPMPTSSRGPLYSTLVLLGLKQPFLCNLNIKLTNTGVHVLLDNVWKRWIAVKSGSIQIDVTFQKVLLEVGSYSTCQSPIQGGYVNHLGFNQTKSVLIS